jgi:hypothetical protein
MAVFETLRRVEAALRKLLLRGVEGGARGGPPLCNAPATARYGLHHLQRLRQLSTPLKNDLTAACTGRRSAATAPRRRWRANRSLTSGSSDLVGPRHAATLRGAVDFHRRRPEAVPRSHLHEHDRGLSSLSSGSGRGHAIYLRKPPQRTDELEVEPTLGPPSAREVVSRELIEARSPTGKPTGHARISAGTGTAWEVRSQSR